MCMEAENFSPMLNLSSKQYFLDHDLKIKTKSPQNMYETFIFGQVFHVYFWVHTLRWNSNKTISLNICATIFPEILIWLQINLKMKATDATNTLIRCDNNYYCNWLAWMFRAFSSDFFLSISL